MRAVRLEVQIHPEMLETASHIPKTGSENSTTGDGWAITESAARPVPVALYWGIRLDSRCVHPPVRRLL